MLTANVAGFKLHNILLENGSSTHILFAKPFEAMGFDRRTVEPAGNPLFGFRGKKVDAVGKKNIPVSFAEGERVHTETITFNIVNIHYPYTAIFGRGVIDKFDIVIRQSYLCMKMPSPFGVITAHGDQVTARRIKGKPTPGYSVTKAVTTPMPPVEEPSEKDSRRARPTEKPLKTPCQRQIPPNASSSAQTSTNKNPTISSPFCTRMPIAWSTEDLQGVKCDLAQHNLNIKHDAKPQKQKLRKVSAERAEVAKEVQRLLDARVIRLIQYPDWLANVVMVKNSNSKWRMCVDFADLNKSCPRDPYPLTRIDTLVDIVAGCEMMSLLDCFLGYHQIWPNPDDEEKTSFITPGGTYCFHRMPEESRNAGSTFSRMTDVVVVSKKKEDHIADLEETVTNLKSSGLRLNPEKCIFGVKSRKMLGCLVSARGIEANPKKIAIIANMKPPKTRKQVQQLAGRLASLNKFIARSAEKGLPFFRTLRSSNFFEWGEEQQSAFNDLKAYLTKLTTLSRTSPRATLLLYIMPPA